MLRNTIASRTVHVYGFVLLSIVSGCGSLRMPSVDLPGVGESNSGMETLVENHVWLDASQPDRAAEVLAFLSDGTLMNGSCGGQFRLTSWRWVDEAVVVWEDVENGGTIRAAVASVGPSRLDLVVDPDGASQSRTFIAVRPPVNCG